MSAYRSTLPVRKSEITQADFRDVPYLTLDQMNYRLATDESLHWWNDHIPLSPAELYYLFSRNFADDIRMDIEPSRDAVKIALESRQPGKFDGEVYIFLDSLKESRQPNSKFYIDDGYQGQGIGKSWMKCLIEVCIALGEKNFRFSAGATNGAYTWARMGAELDLSPHSREARMEQACRVRARIESLRSHMSLEDFRAARVYAHMSDKADPAQIAELRSEMTKESMHSMETPDSEMLSILRKFFQRHPIKNKMYWSAAHDERHYITGVFMNAARHGGPTLAKCLLVGTAWPAIIDFENTRQMEKIGNYLGGWDSIRPA